MSVLSKVLRLGEGRMVKRLKGVANYVDTLSDDVEKLTDEELRGKTAEFKERVAKGESLDDLLPEAFAVAREAAWRVLDQRHFDVQMMGGAALHYGNVAEMKTGEGKTLTCVLPAYLNALAGKGVHVVTVNDYLAKRDAEWMGRVHRFLGLDVGVILSQMMPEERRAAYAADITPAEERAKRFGLLGALSGIGFMIGPALGGLLAAIDIDLPVSGSINDPQFRLGPVIFKAIGNLIVKAITSPFSLLAGALGGGAGDELNTVPFAAGSAELPVMRTRRVWPGVTARLCACVQAAAATVPALSTLLSCAPAPSRALAC